MRTTIIASVAALVVGLLLGLIAGNTIGVVLLRALLTSALVGGGVFGIGLLVKKFLPELSSGTVPSSDLSEMAEPSESGRKVDIVVSDDAEEDEAQSSQKMPRNTEDTGNMFAQESGLEAIVEEVAEEGIDSGDVVADDDGGFDEDSFYAGVENLPDISGFETSFSRGIDEDAGDSEGDFDSGPSSSSSRSSSRSGSKGTADDMDPKIIARAISTALKKG